MKFVAAYLLATLGGKSNPSEKDISKILDSVGIASDKDMIKSLLNEVKGKDVAELIEEGKGKLASMPAGGAAPAAGGAAPAAGNAAPAAEAKKEESEEEDDDMGFSLFD